MHKIKRASGSAFSCIFSDDFRPASPSLWKEYYLKTRQTIQVGSGKLNTSREKHF
jgi:hypothetical protein